ncbi:carbonic anhydrase [Laspinema olomoucense]|uniref:carbonic anhydrase n=1 Tax=Laspinema olomoucense TaxID=3231600 RepID=UPI0021BB4C94|nr:MULTISPECIES: carbonic anhydrase [unclassified Laspinema]MCT7973607.1 carbonic anhydrase [Laspinema sp. D3d]MCT7989348.1 carbonic anhydrase [Laspinema sp. D3a]MCT7992373.1 carbonic anhydrase [Laspinema sp. D3c]
MENPIRSIQISRRNLLKFGAAALGASAVTATLSSVRASKVQANQPSEVSADLSPDDALNLLMEGNQRFVSEKRINPHQSFNRMAEVAETQTPFAALLSCADSRVPVEIVFDQGFGDLFVVRQAGNVVTPEETGSLEFGTAILGAKVVMVLGHERCGAVSAAIKGGEFPGQIGSLVAAITPALANLEGQNGDPLENAIKANVSWEVNQLKKSPVISELIAAGKLTIVGGYYDLDTGEVQLLS